METPNKIYLNKFQLYANMLRPKHLRGVAGRGTGKSRGIIAPRLLQNARAMPRSSNAIVGMSYVQLRERVLSGVIEGWSSLGFRQNEHYFIGSYAPAKLGWDRPFKYPEKHTENIIHTCWGSVIVLVSQDRSGSGNGFDFASLNGDEAKYLDKQRLDEELWPAVRGGDHLWGHMYNYGSSCFTSDVPSDASGDWLLEPSTESDYLDDIANGQWLIDKALLKFYSGKYSESYWSTVKRSIDSMERRLHNERMKLDLLITASSLVNFDALGAEYFTRMLKKIGDDEFKKSILNIKRIRSERSFYNDLTQKRHGYPAQPSGYFMTLGFDLSNVERDCRMDGEYDEPHLPLFISCDSGGSFNCMIVSQWDGRQLRVINVIWMKHPKKIKDIAVEFIRYYAHWQHKEVYYYYDHTSIGTRAETSDTVRDLVYNTIYQAGWTIHDNYIGQIPSHEWRYNKWSQVFREQDDVIKLFRYNIDRCNDLYESCIAANVIDQRGEIHKDKSSEKSTSTGVYKVPQQRATHLSEALDILMCGIYANPQVATKGKRVYV